MEPVKLAGPGPHVGAPPIIYTPTGAHQVPTSRPRDASHYKGTSSPPMSRSATFSYASAVDHGSGGVVAARYVSQNPYAYPRDSTYARPMSERPMMLPHGSRRPSMMAGSHYSPYRANEVMHLVTNSITVSSNADNSKRLKLSTPVKTEISHALVIDTSDNHSSRESPYYPQVEAISPTLPADAREDSPLAVLKADLLKQIETVDNEINKNDSSYNKLVKKSQDLEAAAQKGEPSKQEEEEEAKERKHQSSAQIIYAQNRKRALEAHQILSKLVPASDMSSVLPQYHQPADTERYAENRRHFAKFKKKLVAYLIKKNKEAEQEQNNVSRKYLNHMVDWLKTVDKYENSKKNKEKQGKNRELFEKVFPELRKQREDKERFSRVGARVKSDAEMMEIVEGLQEQENEEKKMRAYAVIPPIMLDERKRRYRYDNTNGVIDDPVAEFKENKNINIWTQQEREAFKDKFLQHPKNFVYISNYLERKSVSDCIQFYYCSKKKENYKALVKRRIRRPRKPNNQPVEEMVGLNSTGVTTRGSVAALQREQQTRGPSSSNSIHSDSNNEESGVTDMTWSNMTSAASLIATSANNTVTTMAATSNPPNAIPTSSIITSDGTLTTTTVSSSQEVREKDKENLPVSDKYARRARKTDDSSDEENVGTGGPHECVACKIQLKHFGESRKLEPSQAATYGLTEASLPSNPRICNACRCRTVRRRVVHCPIPTCQSQKWRIKRLRPFPTRWSILPEDVKAPIITQMEIPRNVSKCCYGCYSRIAQKLGPDAEEQVDPSRWSEEDIDNLKKALAEVGCHWSKVSERVNKSQEQCKGFYYNLKSKYKLDDQVAAYKKAKGKNGPPTVTDEEESGSSTTSGDEAVPIPPPVSRPPQPRHDSASDTASASSPPPTAHSNSVEERDTSKDGQMKEPLPPAPAVSQGDYDSSATLSADESQSGAGRDSPEVQHIPHPGERRPSNPVAPKPAVVYPPPANVASPNKGCIYVTDVKTLIHRTIERSLGNKGEKEPERPAVPTLLNSRPQQYPSPGTGLGLHVTNPRAGLPDKVEASECEGLDLSVPKRDRSPPPPANICRPSQVSSISTSREFHTIRGGAEVIPTNKDPPPRAHSNPGNYSKPPNYDYRYQHDPRAKSPSVFAPDGGRAMIPPTQTVMTSVVSRIPSPSMMYHNATRAPHPKASNKSMPPPPLNSNNDRGAQVTLAPHGVSTSRIPLNPDKGSMHGSITHGTPVNPSSMASVPIKFDLMNKSVISREGGSITQGTPVHHDSKRSSTFCGYEARPSSAVEIIPRPAPGYERELFRGPRPPSTITSMSLYATRPPYSDSQITTRNIIANDYITSQQITRRPHEKDIRGSPRGRDASPQNDLRAQQQTITIDRRIDHRNMERTVESMVRGAEIRPVEIRPTTEIRQIDQRPLDHHRGSFYAHSNLISHPSHSQQSASPLYQEARSARPSISPMTGRDPTPPNSEMSHPHDFRSPNVSTPTPPPSRGASVIRRPKAQMHHMPPKSVSPRHSVVSVGSDVSLHNYVDVIAQRTSYPADIRRDARTISVSHPISSASVQHHPLDTTAGRRSDMRPIELISKDVRLIEDSRPIKYERVRYKDERFHPKKVENELDISKAYPKDIMKQSQQACPSPKPRLPNPNDNEITAGKLIQAIVTNTIIGNKTDSSPRQSMLHVSETDKRVISPATIMTVKENEVVTVDDGPDPRSINHGVNMRVSSAHHPKSIQAHMDSVISREYTSKEGAKVPGAQIYRTSVDVGRDNRQLQQSQYDQWKFRGSTIHSSSEKETIKDRIDCRSSPHVLPPSTSSSHHMQQSHLATDERRIIRIPQTAHNDLKSRTPPVSNVSPPGANHPSGPSDSKRCLSSFTFEYVKSKLAENMRNIPSSDDAGRLEDLQQHSRSNTPSNQAQILVKSHPPQQNSHFEEKRPRLDIIESCQRPPSRPQSTGEAKECVTRDEVADSPQSGEMVIDETPREVKMDSNVPVRVSPQGGGEQGPPPPPSSQYYPYSNYRGHSSSNTSSWGGNAPPPTSSSSRAPQGYEPNVEPVSD